MSKVTTSVDLRAAQDAAKSNPLDPGRTVSDIMTAVYGPSTTESMDFQLESVNPDGTPAAPIDPRPTGFNENDQMIPMGGPEGRFANQKAGVARPEFNQWEGQGMAVADPQMVTPKPSQKVTLNDPAGDLFNRAMKTARMMDPSDTSTPTVNISGAGPSAESRQAQVDLNRRIALEEDPEVADRLRQERGKLAARDKRDNTVYSTYNKIKALQEKPSPYPNKETGQPDIGAFPDPKFLAASAIATENALDQAFLGSDDSTEAFFRGDDFEEGSEVAKDNLVNPSQVAENVGREIVKWWGAEKEAQGQPINKNLSGQELKDLGAAHLLGYARANPDIVNIVRTAKDEMGNYIKDEEGRAIRFELTPLGEAIYDTNRPLREEALGHTIDPLSTPSEAGLPGAKSDVKPAFRNRKFSEGSGRNDKSYATMEEIDESIKNQQSVAHVVDDRRTRIGLTMLLPALFEPIGKPGDAFADAFDIGETSLRSLKNQKEMLDGLDPQAAADEAIKITGRKKKGLVKDLMTAIMFRGRPNYLTYAMQPLTGRTMAQQSDFNPTSKKLIRFVTRSKHPAKVTAGSKAEENYLNIMALSFGKDELLSKGRIQDIKDNHAQYYKWGKILDEALEATLPQAAFEMATEMMGKGGKLPPELVKGLASFQATIAGKDSALYDLLKKKGEDAPMAIDALIDYRKYSDAKEKGRPHQTFVNAYVDGKTNGIANQGMMLGLRKIAAKVGAIRNDGATHAVEGGDIRDEMKRVILNRIKNGGLQKSEAFAGNSVKYAAAMDILNILAGERDINKKISMVFPYGKEVSGMKGEIRSLLPGVRAKNEELDKMMREFKDDEMIINMAHDNVVYSLFEIFGEETFKTRGIMRSVAFMHGVIDQVFSIRGPAGSRLMLGDYRFDPDKQTQSVVKASMKGGGSNALILQDTGKYASSAAERDGKPAGWARGRASVIPTQAIDAATVIRTSSGKSWQRQVDNHPAGEPYFLQIYDAYKVDVNTFDTLVNEVNTNFLDITTRDWNFLEEALGELKRLDIFAHRVADANPNRIFSLKGGRMDYLYKLMDPEYVVGRDGAPHPRRRALKDFLRAAHPINPQADYSAEEGAKPQGKIPQSPVEKMDGYEAWIDKEAERVNRIILREFNAKAKNGIPEITNGRVFLDPAQNPMEISAEQAVAIFDALMRETNLRENLTKFVQKTNYARADLRREIMESRRRSGNWVAQFWAH